MPEEVLDYVKKYFGPKQQACYTTPINKPRNIDYVIDEDGEPRKVVHDLMPGSDVPVSKRVEYDGVGFKPVKYKDGSGKVKRAKKEEKS